MSRKTLIYIFMVVGSTAGGYLPLLWGDSFFSMTSVVLTAVGGFLGIYLAYKLGRNF
ncbi:MAG: hypothetical protein WCQ00_03645 [bacterium]